MRTPIFALLVLLAIHACAREEPKPEPEAKPRPDPHRPGDTSEGIVGYLQDEQRSPWLTAGLTAEALPIRPLAGEKRAGSVGAPWLYREPGTRQFSH